MGQESADGKIVDLEKKTVDLEMDDFSHLDDNFVILIF